jgi:1,4-alpha-glucan branching enzyme
MRAFYTDLIRLRRDLDGDSGGLADPGVEVLHRDDDTKVLVYRRYGASGEDVIVAINLRDQAYATYDFGVPAGGPWRVRLDADWLTYGADFDGGQTGSLTPSAETYDDQPYRLRIALGAYGAVVLTR